MAISVSVKMSEQEILGGSVEPLEPLWLRACSLSSCVPISHLFHNAKSAYQCRLPHRVRNICVLHQLIMQEFISVSVSEMLRVIFVSFLQSAHRAPRLLGNQLLKACYDEHWQEAINLVGKGEWSRSDLRERDENVCKSCVLV